MTCDDGIHEVADALEAGSARRRPWLQVEKDVFARLWADPALSVNDIAQRLGRTAGSVKWLRHDMGLPSRVAPFFFKKMNNREFCFAFPISKGFRKLLDRSDTLIQWVEEGRDNYELARAFHVPMADVVRAVRGLGLVRPGELEPQVEQAVMRTCSACSKPFEATKYRFRCDSCLDAHARYDDRECTVGGR